MKRKLLDKEAEKLEALTQESESSAISQVQQLGKEEGIKKKIIEENEQAYLKANRSKLLRYNHSLANLLVGRLSLIDWDEGWQYEVVPDDIGVILTMKYGDRKFMSAFKPIGDPKYDLNAVDVYCTRAENTMDRVMGHDKTNGVKPNGIIV